MAQEITPDRDSSLGLIYRLNNLWSQTDFYAMHGKYDEWNNVLDALYRNLLYRESIIVDYEGEKVKDIRLSVKDTKVYRFLSLDIAKARTNCYRNRNPRLNRMMRSIWYHKLQKKDIYLRKFMYLNKLYLKETKKDPGSVLLGGFGSKRNKE